MRYEILLLAIPEITGDEASRLESQLRDVITEKKGTCISFERWGKFRLLYPVKKNDYGVYFLARLEAGSVHVRELLDKVRGLIELKHNEVVMRYLINKLDERQSLVYQRPESLEEAPGKVTDSLMREHKVDFGSEGRGKNTHNDKFENDSSEELAWQRK